jgi:hypothetical protein
MEAYISSLNNREGGMKKLARYEARVRVVKAMARPTRMFIVDFFRRVESVLESGAEYSGECTCK